MNPLILPRALALPVLCLLVFTSFLGAQTHLPDVTGRVVSVRGDAVPAAEVTLLSASGRKAAVRADADGFFRFAAVSPGEYLLTAEGLGLSPATKIITVGTDRPADVTLELPEVVRERVNVVGNASAVDWIPGSAQVIAGPEMERAQIATDDVHQMLRSIPGLNIQEEEGYGLRPNIGMRGTGTDRSSKITMMEDGVLVAPAPYSAPAAYYAPVAGRMDSLEVRKGSSQIKYGPITTGGVLNYVSTQIPPAFRLRSNLVTGGDRTLKIAANLGDSFRNFGWVVETFQFRTDGYKRLDGGGDTGVDIEDYLAKFRVNTTPNERMYQELEVKLGRTEQVGDETYLGLTDADFAAAPLRRYAASQADLFESTHEQYQVRHFLARGTWDLTTTAYRNEFARAWYKLDNVLGTRLSRVLADPGGFPAQMAVLTGADSVADALTVRNNNRSYYGMGIQSVLGVSASSGPIRHKIEAGVRLHEDEEDRFQQDDRYQMTSGRMVITRSGAPGSQANRVVNARAAAGFVSDTMRWGNLALSPGLRYEAIDLGRIDYAGTDPARTAPTADIDTSVGVLIPGVGLSYAAQRGLVLFGGVHKGFAPPGPGLAAETKAEESLNYEAGSRLARGALGLEVTGFFNDYSNLLGRDTLSSGGGGDGDLFNGGEARVYGLEASGRWNTPVLDGRLTLPIRLAYTFTSAEFRNTFQSRYGPWGSVKVGHELPYIPRHQFFTSIDVESPQWRARMTATYVGKMRTAAGQGAYIPAQSTDAALVLGLSGEYAITRTASLFASIQNLANRHYIVARHPSGVRPGLPRLVTVGLKLDVGR